MQNTDLLHAGMSWKPIACETNHLPPATLVSFVMFVECLIPPSTYPFSTSPLATGLVSRFAPATMLKLASGISFGFLVRIVGIPKYVALID